MEKTMSLPQKIWKVIKDNPIVVLLVFVCIIVGFTIENFFSFRNLNSLISNTTVRFLIALGVSGCLITKGTDLSAGRAVGLCACLAGTLLQDPTYTGRMYNWPEFNLLVAFLIVVAVGAAFGLVNGLIISKLNVPPFIATLGTQTIIYGICLVFTNAQPIGNFKDSYKNAVNGTWLKGIFTLNGESFPGIPYLLAWAAIFGLLFWFIYNKATHGKYMYAIGGNESAAQVAGVNVSATIIRIYVLASVLYAVAGFLVGAKAGGASTATGFGYELEAIAACTIGGVSTNGGVGKVGGILIGVLVFEVLKICLQFLRVDPAYTFIAQGLVIIVAVALDLRKYLAKK